ncbi:30S ribosomal protein S9 [Chlamydiia bacterium]|jgi:small subunit ribosomal protein S9|nr:30S ribosomal protein S9 [Chlamydiia bacterium]MDA8773891.1 30S ribosomal protein S9 [Chlamydiia bacterium]
MATKKELIEWVGTGRRKRAMVSIRLRKGSGNVQVNKKSISDYFSTLLQSQNATAPLNHLDIGNEYDVIANAKGGGLEAQSTALSLAIARALLAKDEGLKAQLKEKSYLTRDSRKKERKKYGQKKARKKFQFSKR